MWTRFVAVPDEYSCWLLIRWLLDINFLNINLHLYLLCLDLCSGRSSLSHEGLDCSISKEKLHVPKMDIYLKVITINGSRERNENVIVNQPDFKYVMFGNMKKCCWVCDYSIDPFISKFHRQCFRQHDGHMNVFLKNGKQPFVPKYYNFDEFMDDPEITLLLHTHNHIKKSDMPILVQYVSTCG